MSKKTRLGFFLCLLAIMAISCKSPLIEPVVDPVVDPIVNPPVVTPPVVDPITHLNAIETAVALVSANIKTAGFSDAVATHIAGAALAKVRLLTLDEGDLSATIPVATGEAVLSLGALTLTDTEKTTCTKVITESFVAAINGKFIATGRSLNRAVSRDLAGDTASVVSLLERIAKAAVENLKATGISVERRGDVAGDVIGTILGSLNSGGVDKTLVNESVGALAAATIESLVSLGLTGQEAMLAAVSAVMNGAIQGIATITVPGVEAADYAAIASTISSSAASALGSLGANTEEVIALAGALTTGATQGIIQMAQGAGAVSSATALSLVQGVANGTMQGVMTSDFINPLFDSADLIGAVSGAATEAIADATGSTLAGNISVTDALVTGIASGAVSGSSGLSAAEIGAAVTVVDANGAAVVYNPGTAVDAGVIIGTNEPPVAATSGDGSVVIGTAFTVSGTGSFDAEDDALPSDGKQKTFTWALIQRPALSTVSLSGTLSGVAATSVSLTPDVAGNYIVSLKVTDSAGAVSEAFSKVVARADAVNTVFEGKTMAERLVVAKDYITQRDFPKARDELLLILARYPQVPGFDDVLFHLGWAYDGMALYDLALTRYNEALSLAVAGGEVWTKAELYRAWLTLDRLKDFVNAKSRFEAVVASGSIPAARIEAVWGLGSVLMAQGSFLEARAKFIEARDSADADLYTRCYTQRAIANTYFKLNDVSTARTEMQKTLTDSKFYQTDPANAATFDEILFTSSLFEFFNGLVELSQVLKDSAYLTEAMDLLKSYLTDTRLSAFQQRRIRRTLAEKYLWNYPNTKVNAQLAYDYANDGLDSFVGTTIPGIKEKASSLLRRGQTENRLRSYCTLDAEKTAWNNKAEADFLAAITEGSKIWNGTGVVFNARDAAASLYLWQIKNYDKAEAMALTYAGAANPNDAVNNQYRARAYVLLGHIYMAKAYVVRDQYNQDPAALFQKAISYYIKAKYADYPATMENDWYFIEALQGVANCYSELGNYLKAREFYQQLLANASLDTATTAWNQIGLAWTYDAEMRWELDHVSVNNAITTILPLAKAAYLETANIKEDDGSYPENGNVYAEALHAFGQLEVDAVTYYMYGDGTSTLAERDALLTDALVHLNGVTWAAFPDLQQNLWIFGQAFDTRGRAYDGLRRFGEARTSYQDLIDAVANGLAKESFHTQAMRSLASSYRSEADSTEVTDQASLDAANALYESSIAKYWAVRNLDGGVYGGGKRAAKSLNDIFYIYNSIMYRTFGLYGHVISLKPEVDSWLADAKAVMDNVEVFKVNGVLPENGSPAASVVRGYGYMQTEYAAFTYHTLDAATRDAAYLAELEKALITFRHCVDTYAGTQADTYIDAKAGLAQVLFNLCGSYYIPADNTKFKDAFLEARTITEAILVDADTPYWLMGRVAMNLGWAYLNAYINNGNAVVASGIADETTWRSEATRLFNLALSDPAYCTGDNYWVGDNAQSGLDWLTANPMATTLSKSQRPNSYVRSYMAAKAASSKSTVILVPAKPHQNWSKETMTGRQTSHPERISE